MNTEKKDIESTPDVLDRLVRLVESAIRSQEGKMILDIHVDDELRDAIRGTLKENIEWGNGEKHAIESALRNVFDSHETRMTQAATDDANMGLRRALDSLPSPELTRPKRSPKVVCEKHSLPKTAAAEQPRDEGLSSGDLLARYHAVCAELETWRVRFFPRRSFVRVEGVGVGVVVAADGRPPHKLAVLVESGNVWFYELDRCEPTTAKHAGYSLRKIWLARNGYKLLPMSRFRFRHRTNAASKATAPKPQ